MFVQEVAKQETPDQPAARPPIHSRNRESHISAVSAEKQFQPQRESHREPEQAHPPTVAISDASPTVTPDILTKTAAVQIPQALPAGSVYAPVTVNLDSSLLAGQMLSLEHRLETMLDEKAAVNRPQGRKVARSDRRKTPSKNVEPTSVPDESLNQITDGLQQLATSLKELEQKTESSLTELSKQTAQQEASSRTQMEEWQRLIDYRLRTAELAARTVVAVAPSVTTSDVPTQEFVTPPSAGTTSLSPSTSAILNR